MEIKGKKVVILGDSITEGVGVSEVCKRYTDVFEKMTGCTVYNHGICGTRIARQIAYNPLDSFDKDYIGRVEELEEDADIVVVFGGTNDFGHGDAPFGEFTDNTEYTFCGACHVLMRKLIEKYPHSPIIFMTPLHRLTEESPFNDKGMPHKLLKEYVDEIKKTAEYYSIPVLDLWSISGMQPAIPIIQETYMPDGLHPNDAGAKIIAERLKNFLLAL